jgi:two-component system, NtrC family, nitrogen regulation response regulator NtrX
LVHRFLEDICNDYGMPKKMIADDAVRQLQDYNWSGNIRELRNVVERLVILSGKSINREDVKTYVAPK